MTPEANAQGANRFERALYMFQQGQGANPSNSWELHDVADCGHDRSCMAPEAQDYLLSLPSLFINLTSLPPNLVDTAIPVDVTVEIIGFDEDIVPGSAVLLYRLSKLLAE